MRPFQCLASNKKQLTINSPPVTRRSISNSLLPDNALSQQFLLEVSQNISLYYAPRILSKTDTLVLLSIDPTQFHVYWNLADYHQYSHPDSQKDYDLKLRVFSQHKEYSHNKQAKLVYEATVSANQSQQKISLLKTEYGVVYRASLGKELSENSFIALVNSNVIYSLHETNKKDNTVNKNNDYQTDSMGFLENLDICPENIKKEDMGSKQVKPNKARVNRSGQGKK